MNEGGICKIQKISEVWVNNIAYISNEKTVIPNIGKALPFFILGRIIAI